MHRSFLFVPAANAKAIAKAPSLGADVLILDLEDGLAPEQKDQGRAAAIRFLRENKQIGKPVFVRINAGPEAVQRADIWAIASEEPAAILVPKVQNGQQLRTIHDQIGNVLHGTQKQIPTLWAMIETAFGLVNIKEIAANRHIIGLGGLIAGTNDLVQDLKCANTPDRAPLQSHLAQIVLQARAWDLLAIDGVYNNFSDPEGFAREAAQGKELGFDGKTLIHPAQIEPTNTAFGPSPAQIKHAKAVVRAYSYKKNAGKGAIQIDGQMVERLHLEAAKKLLAGLNTEMKPK
jgi:citrate lyase subunit beta/citryl-CoA lyase